MKNIILKYYFKITAIGIFSAFLVGCSGLKVMVETEQPEDDFVVQCVWSSKNFKIHGGKSEVHRKAFVASSGEIVDCGTFWRGKMSFVQILHPLYIYGNEYEKNIYDSEGEIKEVVSVYKMKLVEDYLDELISEFKGKKLVRITRDRLGGGFSYRYLSDFNAEKKIKPGYFKEKYEKRLTQYWEKLLPIIQVDFSNEILRNYTVEDFVNRYWKTVNKFYRLTQEEEDKYE